MIDRPGGLPIYAEADFCITGTVEPGRKLARRAVWRSLGLLQPGARFSGARSRAGVSSRRTRSGRSRSSAVRRRKTPIFGQLIHELTGPAIPSVVPGLQAVHAVDAAGVHPLLLAIGSERYVPYASARAVRPNCSRWPTPCWARGNCRWPSIC